MMTLATLLICIPAFVTVRGSFQLMRKMRQVGKFDTGPTSVTLVCITSAELFGVGFSLDAWVRRPLSCAADGGTVLPMAYALSIFPSFFAMFIILGVVNLTMQW